MSTRSAFCGSMPAPWSQRVTRDRLTPSRSATAEPDRRSRFSASIFTAVATGMRRLYRNRNCCAMVGRASSSGWACSGDCVDVPFPRHTFQHMLSAIGEVDPGAHHEILDGAGGQHLALAAERSNAGADVDGDALDPGV